MRVGEFGCLTFDCYGTLIDWEAGLLAVLAPWAVGIEEDALLTAFAEAETVVQSEVPTAPYPTVLAEVQRRLGRRFGIPVSSEQANRLAESVGVWPPFPDTSAALDQLGRRHRLVVVSNVDAASFGSTASQLGVRFDAVVTAEAVGAYKPDPRMFEAALQTVAEWGITPEGVLHVAQSLYHDIVPAAAAGIATAWVDRRRGRAGGATPAPAQAVQPDLVVSNLAELAALD